MASRPPRLPKYALHNSCGHAVVRMSGRTSRRRSSEAGIARMHIRTARRERVARF